MTITPTRDTSRPLDADQGEDERPDLALLTDAQRESIRADLRRARDAGKIDWTDTTIDDLRGVFLRVDPEYIAGKGRRVQWMAPGDLFVVSGVVRPDGLIDDGPYTAEVVGEGWTDLDDLDGEDAES